MAIRIALAGNPNSGKTTLFNELTGSRQYVGNWPGVTVEKKEGELRGSPDVIIQDLPGIYSLSPYTLEEVITRKYLVNERPDAIINIVDGTNIERNLYLTTQLIELNIPVVIAINMMDLVRRNGDSIDLEKLSQLLRCPVVALSALKGEGCLEVAALAIELAKTHEHAEIPHVFAGSVEHALAHIEESIQDRVEEHIIRWYAVKLFERDERVLEALSIPDELKAHIDGHTADCERELNDDAESIIADQRYTYITGVVASAVVKKHAAGVKMSTSDKIDRIVTGRVLALPIFAAVMWGVYTIAIGTVGGWTVGFVNDTLFGELISANLGAWLESMAVAPWLIGLTVDGIVGGVGAVLGFVPQMLILFFLLSVLEDIGYMSRVAFIMDKLFRKFGLSGKSFIPMLIGSGCSVPGIMASRTIEQERDRRMTIMTTSFIPCGAKMPIIALFAGAVFGGSPLVAVSAYFIGVAAVVITGIMLKKTRPFAGHPAPFVMELPNYHIPSPKNVFRATWERGWSFIRKAGTVILASSVILWFMQAFGFAGGGLALVEDNNSSILASIGNVVAPAFAPLGFGDWKAAVSVFTGLIAKENVVSTFGVLYGFAETAGDGMEMWQLLSQDFTPVSAYSFMIFNLICAPCFAAIGAIRREMNSPRWTAFAIAYQCVFAYTLSLIVYQAGTFIATGVFGAGTAAAAAAAAALIYMLLRKNRYAPARPAADTAA